MREIILSFQPKYFAPILTGTKQYEYRSRFSKQPVKAYLYLSSPIQCVIGSMVLDEPIDLSEHITSYKQTDIQYQRLMQHFSEGVKLALPIRSLELFKSPVTLTELRGLHEGFRPPMSYSYASNYPQLHLYLQGQSCLPVIHINDTPEINHENMGMFCHEMENLPSHQRVLDHYRAHPDYNSILVLLGLNS